MPIPDGISREHVLAALKELSEGVDHPFGLSTDYDLLHDGTRYPPKAVIGMAARHATGRMLEPSEFSGGESPGAANSVLRSLGFEVVTKGGSTDTTDRPPVRTLVASTDEENWELCQQYGIWGVRSGNHVGLGRVSRLQRGDQLAVWLSGTGFVALARLTSDPQIPWPEEHEVPWVDEAQYGARMPIELTEEFDPPAPLEFVGGYAPALRMDKNSLFSFGQLDDAQVERIREISEGTVSPDSSEPFRRAWFVLQKESSSYQDQEGRWYHYPIKNPNARRVEAGDYLIIYRTRTAGSNDAGLLVGAGRVREVIDAPEEHRYAVFDRYLQLEPPRDLKAIGGDPRLSSQHSISSMNTWGVRQLLELSGISSFDDLEELPEAILPQQGAVEADSSHVLAVYIGGSSIRNFEFSVDDGVWGWRRHHSDYDGVEPGDLVVFGIKYTGGSPRVALDDWSEHDLSDVVVGRITSPVEEAEEPYWPDEKGEPLYPYRLSFELIDRLGETPTAAVDDRYGEGVSNAIRKSAGGAGRGVLVSVIGGRQDMPVLDTANVTLADVCEAFADAVRESNLDYGGRHEELIRSFVTSLATKGFVLLTGLSGSGKTRLAMAFGQWLGKGHLKIIAVRPDWTGPDTLLGYENQLSEMKDGKAWDAPEALRFMLRAARDPDNPYLLLLDEMNLAHVERYFADVLSGIESREAVLPNLAESDGEWRLRPGEDSHIPFPSNLFVVGTVNIDETTYMFSPKVLDRANTLEFRVLTSELTVHGLPPKEVQPGDRLLIRRFLEDSQDQAMAAQWSEQSSMAKALIQLHEMLACIDREFGHRVFSEALRFGALLDRAGESDWHVALDLQVMQKVLPRFHGAVKQIAEPLDLLGSWCYYGPFAADASATFDPLDEELGEPPALPISFDKVRRMKRRVLANHFVSFAE